MPGGLADRNCVIVAARTNPGRVVLVFGGVPADKTMAFITLICGHGDRRMARRLAGCQASVVASRTDAWRDAIVIPGCRSPCRRSMALIARGYGITAHFVTGRFASCLAPVVASTALSGRGRPVVIARTQKRRCIEVAAFAWSVGHDMSIGFRRCHNALAERVTAVTVLRRAFEYTAHMTGLAWRRGMPSGKRETRGRVIEIAATQLRFSHGLKRSNS